MKTIKGELNFFKRLLDMMEKQLGNNSEILLHDYAEEFDHTVIDIRNGHITGRSIGACSTNLGLEILRGDSVDGDRYNYITHRKDGRILRSSSMYIHNDDGKVIGAICINTDITEMVKFESYLHNINNYELYPEPVNEVFDQDIITVLDELIKQALVHVGKSADEMTRSDKIEFIRFLDKRGVFYVTKSSDKICDLLGISKYTFYNYLGSGQKKERDDQVQSEALNGQVNLAARNSLLFIEKEKG